MIKDQTKEQLNYYWEEAKKLLEHELTEVAMEIWIKKLEPLYISKDSFVFQTNDSLSKTTIEQRYSTIITEKLQAITETTLKLRVIIPNESSFEQARVKALKDEKALNERTNLKSKYNFDTFVRGKSNELAYAACVAIAEAPGLTSYNPLFLYGGVGLGKTHLMHSIGNLVSEHNPDSKVLYCSSETFTNELINSIRERKNQEFRNKYRQIDVLLIDDIQFLSDKEGTQEEFFHTFNALYDANKQIVISSDQPPRELKTLEDRLRSRFGCGLIVDISSPDYETRVAILGKKAELEKIVIPKDVTGFIAKNIFSNIRELEGALNKVVAFATLCKMPITMELAENALRDLVTGQAKPEVTVEYIQDAVANYYNIAIEDILSKKRTKNISYPRQIAMYLSRKLVDMSLPKIGNKFGGRDHSTVIHACDKIAFEIENNIEFNQEILNLESRIKSE